MRTLAQLYELLLEEIQISEPVGICCILQYLLAIDKLTKREYLRITDHFRIYPKPSSFKLFSPYYFNTRDKESRIAFIKEILSSLKET